ncbi:MAG: tetratricopeptide repeat protein [Gemmatimonadota bacterium]
MPLDADRWLRLRAIFEELSELPRPEQARRLAELTFGDPSLRAELEALLVASRDVGDRFEQPAFLPEDLAHPPAESIEPGTRIGPYEIIREIGRGGMGAVYEALRVDAEFSKRVALKMVPAGRDTEMILRRFRYERQILARLEHKNIAALLDGGVTPDGRPFFAMEYVEGERIDHSCARRQLDVRERLQLFRQVCAAVHYAHQNLVVHRDLKPGNILVGPDGTVKLLDFGIAKLLDPTDDDDTPALTETGMLPMTTSYASPEQLRGEPVSTATDIYSLGIVLYELLAGRPPFVGADLPVLEIRRRMLEEAPVPPSEAASAETAAASGEGTTDRLRRALAGELDNIVLMALRKEPDRRYSSAEQLSEDVLRFLAGLPVQAQPDSVGYRTRKFVRRNRGGVAGVVVAALSLVVGTVVSLWQLGLARVARDRAEIERATAQQVTEFFRSVLTAAKPANLGQRVTVAEAVDSAVTRLDSAFADRPLVRRALWNSLGSTLNELDQPDRAEPILRRAYALTQSIDSGRPTWEGATSEYNLAFALWSKGQLAEAESLMRRSLVTYEKAGETPAAIAAGYNSLSALLADRGQLDVSAEMAGKAVAVLRKDPKGGRSLVVALNNYAASLSQLGRYDEALPLAGEAVNRAIALRGPNDVLVGAMLQPLAFTLSYLGRNAEADSLARRSYRIRLEALGAGNTATLISLRTVAEIWVEQGRWAEAIPKLREIIGYRNQGLQESEPNLGSAYLLLGRALAATGQPVEAEAAAREALALRLRHVGETHWLTANTKSVLGEVLARQGRRAEAEPLMVEGLAGLERELGAGHVRTRQARDRLAALRRQR